MDDVTLPELTRRVGDLDRRFNDYVQKAIYEANVTHIREDISEIKDSQKWAMRLIAGQFVALVIGLLIWLVQRIPT